MHSQLAQATLRVREMILRGELAPGARLTEAGLAERLGMSRTPIRQALPLLAREGLLLRQPTRGYVVRGFTQADIADAVEVRAVLEGLAARRLAERGASEACLAELRECLREGDALLARGEVSADEGARYAAMNVRLHQAIVEGGGGVVIADALDHNSRVPFAGPQAVAFDRNASAALHTLLLYAHRQHHAIVHCIATRQAARAEALMREHAMTVMDSIGMPSQGAEIPGLSL